jgi:hypothetical protein
VLDYYIAVRLLPLAPRRLAIYINIRVVIINSSSSPRSKTLSRNIKSRVDSQQLCFERRISQPVEVSGRAAACGGETIAGHQHVLSSPHVPIYAHRESITI